jgi:hypothetical protein
MASADEKAPSPRWSNYALAAVALGGLVVRLLPLVRAGGPLGSPIDYDEGVYFSAAALLFKGVLPYRDFVFVHPPGLLYFLGLTAGLASWVDAAHAFAAARIVATVIGAANVFLVGRLVMRQAGPVGALIAAALYATYPEVVVVERGPYLEPVLNFTCLAMAYVWLSPRVDRSRSPLWAGLLCGAALAVKVWGGIWLLAALASVPKGRFRAEVPKFLGAATFAGCLMVLPLALPSLRSFLEQTLFFHAWRPADGDIARLPRLTQIVNGRHLAASLLAMTGFGVTSLARLRGRGGDISREQHFFGAAWVLTIAAFLASSAYWNQYNAHLAASECVLAGLGAGALFRWVEPKLPRRAFAAVVALLVSALAFPSLRRCVLDSRGRSPELLALARAVRAQVPPDACLFAFEPAWGIAGGRLPCHDAGAPVLVDTYGAMLLEAVRGGARYPDAGAGFQSPAAQTSVRARLAASRFVVMGWRGNWQLTGEARVWFEAHFTPRQAPGADGLDLWERTTP